MENDKTRILVRFRPEISECFELQAIYEGLRVGTIANRVLREEIEKVRRAGKGHIITRDSAEFEEYETAGKGSDPVYVLPNAKEVIAYMPDQARKRGAGADGLIIEVHNNPAKALCDGQQSLTPAQFDDLMKKAEQMTAMLGKQIVK